MNAMSPTHSAGAGVQFQMPPAAGPNDPEVIEQEIQRLRWQCRRGMLELDLLLNRFLDTTFGDLTNKQRIDFVRLLGYQDQIIHDWLMAQSVPAEPALRELITLIRAAMHP